MHHSAKEQHFKGLVSKENPQNGSPFGFPSQEFAVRLALSSSLLAILGVGAYPATGSDGGKTATGCAGISWTQNSKTPHTAFEPSPADRRDYYSTTAPRGRKSAVELGQRATFGKARIHTIGELAAHGKQGLLGVAALADDVRISATHRLPLLRAKQGNMPYGRPVLSN